MSDPVDRLLEDAAGALRAETAGPSPDAAATRARVLGTHRVRTARASQVTTWLAMAAAILLVLGGSTAWAYWTGRLDRWLAPEPTEPSPVGPVTPAATRPRAPRPEIVAPEPLVPEVTAPELPSETAVPEEAAVSGDVATTIAPAVTAETPAPAEEEPIDPAERRAYRDAHALHFDAHDAAGAVQAWDRYLRDYPRGRFALEARYNRALCLVRLDRHEEARAALEPFARGTHGGYRRTEATALLEALGEE